MSVIYRITNMMTGDYYIGSAMSFERRKWQHCYDFKRGIHKNPKMQAAWNKYGEDAFVFEIVEVIPEGVVAYEVENTYLAKCVGQPDCYNVNVDAFTPRLGIPHTAETKAKLSERARAAVADGRGGCFIPTEETKEKMSRAAKGNKSALGYKRTDAEREAIRQRTLGNQHFKGKRHSEETKLKLSTTIYACMPTGELRTYPSLTALRDDKNVSITTIVRACKSGKRIQVGAATGWRLSYTPISADQVPEEYADMPRTRALAIEEGARFYFTGEPCARGHISHRAAKGTCVECRREDDRAAADKRRRLAATSTV